MAKLKLSYDVFGGPKEVFNCLCMLGILNIECPKCHVDCHDYFLEDRNLPRLECSCGYEASCLTGSVFEKCKIRNVPAFLFVLKCFVLRVPRKAIVGLTGSKDDTIGKYLNVIRDALCQSFDQTSRDPSFMFGGEGKVVEVDEAFICHRKNHKGRIEAKEGVWVVGITEVDKSTHRIENEELMVHLQEVEEARQKAAEAAEARRKILKTRKKAARVPNGPVFNGVTIPLDLPDGDEPLEFVEDVPVIRTVSAQQTPTVELRKEAKAVFSQSRKGKAKKTMFFIVEHRDAQTLEKIIGEFVLPGSTVFTDEWAGYNGLAAMGYNHHTICHKRRFSRFIFKDETATRITTNHIERMWVELRKTMKYMKTENLEKYLNLEPYRLLHLYGTTQECFKKVLLDVGKFGKI